MELLYHIRGDGVNRKFAHFCETKSMESSSASTAHSSLIRIVVHRTVRPAPADHAQAQRAALRQSSDASHWPGSRGLTPPPLWAPHVPCLLVLLRGELYQQNKLGLCRAALLLARLVLQQCFKVLPACLEFSRRSVSSVSGSTCPERRGSTRVHASMPGCLHIHMPAAYTSRRNVC